jgi:glycosyltransferase involved in cell wall biosynthesis
MKPTIEITIPVLNEEETLANSISIIIKFISSSPLKNSNILIVIADNGSIDQTPLISQKLSLQYQQVKYIRLEKKGVGLALKESWMKSEADIVGYMDLDLSTDLKHLFQTFELLLTDSADIVAASRLSKESYVFGRSFVRGLASRVFNLLVRFVFNSRFKDGMCGFKFLKKNVFLELQKFGLENDGWFFSTELLIVAEHLTKKIYDLPVTWIDDRRSKVKIIKLSIEYMFEIKNLYMRLKKRKSENYGSPQTRK